LNLELRPDALAIWQAAVEAVRSDRLVRENLRVEGGLLVVGEQELPLDSIRRIAVVGAGKAGAGMAAGVEQTLGPRLLAEKQVSGWVNVPADCVRTLGRIHLHAARPAGVNEPTAEGVAGSERILEIVAALGPDDLCLCLLSGGGSALLPAPVPGLPLADKQAVTRHLSAAGANIQELNTVRKELSRIKGGGLARACRAGRLVTLIISDVLGDPLDVIASGPTVPSMSTAREAISILERYGGGSPAILECLRRGVDRTITPTTGRGFVRNLVIGNNALAVDAAGQEAVRRGYSPAMTAATTLEGPAEEIGVHLARMLRHMVGNPKGSGVFGGQESSILEDQLPPKTPDPLAFTRQMVGQQPNCLITGGEPTVRLLPEGERGKGGRNQQLVLAALAELIAECGLRSADLREPETTPQSAIRVPQFCLLSAGTDGEDGPTDAAGAVIDNDLLARLAASGLDPRDFLRRNDAYTLFDRLGGLIKSGPTHTNVCDIRVLVCRR
jgi:glycerate 2-kinase